MSTLRRESGRFAQESIRFPFGESSSVTTRRLGWTTVDAEQCEDGSESIFSVLIGPCEYWEVEPGGGHMSAIDNSCLRLPDLDITGVRERC
jgi:hypothetical protein